MKKTKQSVLSGTILALTMATLSGCHMKERGTELTSKPQSNSTTDLVHCYGVNKCKGHNDCGGANNSCHGMANCKGQGFITLPTKACADVGGKVQDEWVGKISTSDLIQCYGVNVCGGHNSCQTANNACSGKGSCKGQGFIAATAKSCDEIGGEIDE